MNPQSSDINPESSEVNIGAEGIDVGFEGGAAGGGDPADGASLFSGKAFFDSDVAGRGQFVDLYAQIACCGFGFLAEIDEVGLFDVHQYRHHGQAQL